MNVRLFWYSIEYYGTLYVYIIIYTSITYMLVLSGFLFHSPVNEQFDPADWENNDRMGTIKRKLGCDL